MRRLSFLLRLTLTLSLFACSGSSTEPDGEDAGVRVCDDGDQEPCYSGASGTQGVGLCRAGTRSCLPDGSGFGACSGEVVPVAETCNTEGDDDCDGETNEGGDGCTCVPDSTEPCFTGPTGTRGVGLCSDGAQTCNPTGTGFGTCAGEVLPAAESCATAGDDDCDGTANEDCVCTPGVESDCYSGPVATAGVGTCRTGRWTCNPNGLGFGACVGEVLPVPENCSTPEDDDCDGQTNESCVCVPGAMQSCYTGPAGTQGVGMCKAGTQTCNSQGSGFGPCTGEVIPAASESCSTTTDDNCNGQVNEGCPAGVSYETQVKPIFQAKCDTCHTSGSAGGQNFATNYADTQDPSGVCSGLTVGACTLVRIQNGSMPQGQVCTGNPTTDSGNPACLTSAEQATIQAWITGGQQP